MSDEERSLHHRIWPYSTEVTQHAVERRGREPWIVRDRQAALRAERQGQGRALMRVWTPDDWTLVSEEEQ